MPKVAGHTEKVGYAKKTGVACGHFALFTMPLCFVGTMLFQGITNSLQGEAPLFPANCSEATQSWVSDRIIQYSTSMPYNEGSSPSWVYLASLVFAVLAAAAHTSRYFQTDQTNTSLAKPLLPDNTEAPAKKTLHPNKKTSHVHCSVIDRCGCRIQHIASRDTPHHRKNGRSCWLHAGYSQ